MKFFFLSALAFSVCACTGANKNKEPKPNDDVIPATTQLEQIHKGILKPLCASCHNGELLQANEAESQTAQRLKVPLDFSSLESTKAHFFDSDGKPTMSENPVAKANGWLLVKPGDARKSFLIRKMEEPGVGEGGPMPNLRTRCRVSALNFIKDWIDAGADPEAPAISGMTYSKLGKVEERESVALTFEDPDTCERCHPKHVEQWSISNHAYGAIDPVFIAMSKMGQQATKGKLGQFCVQCHAPIGFVRNEVPVKETSDGIFEQDLSALSEIAQKGVSCDVCHSITDVLEPHNARMSMTPNGIKLGTLIDPVPTEAHASSFNELLGQSEVCAPCHNVINPKGALLEETFDEWSKSKFAIPGPDEKTCQDCHMPASMGQAATDGPLREIHDHTMVGVDVSLVEPDAFPGYYELREASAKLLRSAADLRAKFINGGKLLEIEIENLAGHALPSGATAERQMWLHVQVFSPDEELLFESGMLDANGDLMDGNPKHSLNPEGDPQLVKFAQDFLDVKDIPQENYYQHVVDMPWQAAGIKNHLIDVEETKILHYDLNELALPAGSTAKVQLKFRSFPMYFLRLLEEKAELDPMVKTRVPIVVMQNVKVNLEEQ